MSTQQESMNDTTNLQQATQQPQQPQPQPQPHQVQQQHYQQIPATIPAIQNTLNYMAIGPQGQLYSYDLNLRQWGMANSQQMEKIMVASGIPPQTLQAIKNVLGSGVQM